LQYHCYFSINDSPTTPAATAASNTLPLVLASAILLPNSKTAGWLVRRGEEETTEEKSRAEQYGWADTLCDAFSLVFE